MVVVELAGGYFLPLFVSPDYIAAYDALYNLAWLWAFIGAIGLADGGFEEAMLSRPQWLAFHNGDVVIAEKENHAIRQADLARRRVETIVGTGVTEPLSTPWDVTVVGEHVYVAMAGSHRIGRPGLRSGRVEVYAGSGREARIDGPLDRAAFAQPPGLRGRHPIRARGRAAAQRRPRALYRSGQRTPRGLDAGASSGIGESRRSTTAADTASASSAGSTRPSRWRSAQKESPCYPLAIRDR